MSPVFNKDSFNFPGTEDYLTEVFTKHPGLKNLSGHERQELLKNIEDFLQEVFEDAEERIKDS